MDGCPKTEPHAVAFGEEFGDFAQEPARVDSDLRRAPQDPQEARRERGLGAGGLPPLGIEELAYVAEAGAKVGEFADYLQFVLVVGQLERTGRLVGKSSGLQELDPDFAAGPCHLVSCAGGLANG